MEKELDCIKACFKDGEELELNRCFVTELHDEGDSVGVRVFADTEEEIDVMAFRLAMLNDLKDVGIIKAAADDGMLDEEIKERAAVLVSKLIAKIDKINLFACQMCVHEIPCGEGKCDMYEEDGEGYSCLDEHGFVCKKNKGTPCDGCIDNDFKNFCLKTDLI